MVGDQPGLILLMLMKTIEKRCAAPTVETRTYHVLRTMNHRAEVSWKRRVYLMYYI